MSPLIRLRDFNFFLYDVLKIEQLCENPLFKEHSKETFNEMMEVAKNMAEEQFEPIASQCDSFDPRLEKGEVILLPELEAAISKFVEAGFIGSSFPEEWGGMGLPYSVYTACAAMFGAANLPAIGYPFLTIAAANLLLAHGSKEQKETYLRPLIEGRYFGTMCLSESHAGSSLSDIKTRAIPKDDGSYFLKGSKMWISAGDHQLSENIIHLVLAKLPHAPDGVKGISLFIVPKFLEDKKRNDIKVVGLNHKMGYKATVNTVLALGDEGECRGFLVGEEHKGLLYMFHMMNEARIGVGMGAAACGYAGFRYSLDYAKERPQGRNPLLKDPNEARMMIIEHADVRRMLLQQKAYAEGGLMISLYCAKLFDLQNIAKNEGKNSEEINLLLDLLTPIVKAWPSEYCLEGNSLAIQVLGGYGYTKDYPVERIYRDNRLNPIHEGTNGIQALDLLGRKILGDEGKALQILVRKIKESIIVAEADKRLASFARDLSLTLKHVEETTQTLGRFARKGELARCLSNATPYLHFLGHTVIGWMWLLQAIEASKALEKGEDDFLEGKIKTTQYFYAWELPKTKTWGEILSTGERVTLEMEADFF
jgi:butyryl-CoA dehydrogenase